MEFNRPLDYNGHVLSYDANELNQERGFLTGRDVLEVNGRIQCLSPFVWI